MEANLGVNGGVSFQTEFGDELNPHQKLHLAPYQQPCASQVRPSPLAVPVRYSSCRLLCHSCRCVRIPVSCCSEKPCHSSHTAVLSFTCDALRARFGQYSSALEKHLPRRLAGSWQLSSLPRPHSQSSSPGLRVLAAGVAHVYAPNASASINSYSVTSILQGNWRLTLLGGVGSPAHRLGKSCRC